MSEGAETATIADITRDLIGRLQAVLPGTPVGAAPEAEGLCLTLAALLPEPPPAEIRRPLALVLDYRLEARMADPLAAQAALGEAAFALMTDAELELRAAEGPALLLRRRLLRARPQPRVARVREPLRVTLDRLTALTGEVLGPGGQPVAGTEVTLPALDRRATTAEAARVELVRLVKRARAA